MTTRQRPKVFLSFAGNDRPMATRLKDDLREYGFEALVEARDIEPGADMVRWMDREITESDFFVLLWSRNCVDRPWVEIEWSMAVARGLNEGRSFLYVVRLDETEMPLLLGVRRYIDGFPDWSAVAAALASAWRGRLMADTPVYPAPDPKASEPGTVAVLVRNESLDVTHVVGVAPESTGADLLPVVRTALRLPDSLTKIGALEIRFSYRLLRDGAKIPDKPIATQGITDDTVLDLVVLYEIQRPDRPTELEVYRGPEDAPSTVSDRSLRVLVREAFAHLLPDMP